MRLSESKVLSIISERLPDFHPGGSLQLMDGGNLNYVWRLKGEPNNLIIKIAPPYIAADPEVPLSTDRIRFEASALRLFQEGNRLHSLSSGRVSPPNIEFYDHKNKMLVMEDVGSLPHLGEADLSKAQFADVGERMGEFLAQLHKQTLGDAELAKQFKNIDIQQTRLEVQYKPAGEYAKKAGVADGSKISKNTEALGNELLNPGHCLIMGDLWPSSILLGNDKIHLIDWEFAHFGHPLQDVGHFAAHCWMLAHTTSSKRSAGFEGLWQKFWDKYQGEMGDSFHVLFGNRSVKDMATHMGAEIFVRAAGPFKEGYVYGEYDFDHPLIEKATQKAKQLILTGQPFVLWE